MTRPLRLGLPKGRLRGRSAQLIREIRDRDVDAEIYQIRVQDIPGLVDSGQLDAGVTGEEWIAESDSVVTTWLDLEWYSVRVSLIGTDGGPASHSLPRELTLASEYPRLAHQYAATHLRESTVRILPTHGSTEMYVPTIAGFAIDCVETGATLRAHGLVVLDELMTCSVVLVGRPDVQPPSALIAAARASTGSYQLERA